MIVGKIGVSVEEDLHLEEEVDPLSFRYHRRNQLRFKVPFYFNLLPIFFADIMCLHSEKSPEKTSSSLFDFKTPRSGHQHFGPL